MLRIATRSVDCWRYIAVFDSNPKSDGTTSTAVASAVLLLQLAVVVGSPKNGIVGSLALSEIVGDLEEDDTDGKEDDGQPPGWYDRAHLVPY